MNDTIVEQMVSALRRMKPFSKLAASSKPQRELWFAVNEANLALRLPLYHQYLGKPAPKQPARDAAVQYGLGILAAFAPTVGTRQVVVSSRNGYICSISFQPRPFDFTWTAKYGMSSVEYDPEHRDGSEIGVDDMLFMAAKTMCAAGHYQWTAMHDAVGTLQFKHTYDVPMASILVRETNGHEHRAELLH